MGLPIPPEVDIKDAPKGINLLEKAYDLVGLVAEGASEEQKE